MGNESSTHVPSDPSRVTRAMRFACERFLTGCSNLYAIRAEPRRGMRLAGFARWDGPHLRVGRVSEEMAV